MDENGLYNLHGAMGLNSSLELPSLAVPEPGNQGRDRLSLVVRLRLLQ